MASALKGLKGVLSKKATAAPAPELPVDDAPDARPVGRAGRPSKDARTQVMLRMFPDERKALRQIALDADTTVQELLEDVVRDLIERHQGHRPNVGASASEKPVRAVEREAAPDAPAQSPAPPAKPADAPAAINLPNVRWPKGTTPEEAHVVAQLVREHRPSMASRPLAKMIATEIGVKVSHEFVESLARAQGVSTRGN